MEQERRRAGPAGASGRLCLASLGLALIAFAGASAQDSAVSDDAAADGDPPTPTAAAAAEEPRAPVRQVLLMAAGRPTGVGFAVAGAVGRIIDDQAPVTGLRAAIQATTGSMESIVRLAEGDFDLALVGADWLAAARAGDGAFEGQPGHQELRLIAALYPEALTVMVRANEGIGGLGDLAGLRINLGPPDAASRPLFERALLAAGVTLDVDGDAAEMPLATQGQALCLGEVDAVAYLTAHPSGTVRSVATACPVTILPIEGEVADSLLAQDPALLSTFVPAGYYPGPIAAVPTIGSAVVLASSAALDEVDGYEVTRALFEELNALCVQVPVLAECDPRMMAEAAAGTAPRHDGAARYLTRAFPESTVSEPETDEASSEP